MPIAIGMLPVNEIESTEQEHNKIYPGEYLGK